MLSLMSLVDQWQGIENGLDPSWSVARLSLDVDGSAERAAALLGPLNPGRRGSELRFLIARDGSSPGPEALRRLLRKLDAERIPGRLELVEASRKESPVPAATEPAGVASFVAGWAAEVAKLPPDWSDVWAEIDLLSSDYLERAALQTAPLNPRRAGNDRTTLRFRSARRYGYGASPQMVHRCLERCDSDGIRGSVRVLRALSDTDPVSTQGPVWYVDGQVV
jgi:hypothetical protein